MGFNTLIAIQSSAFLMTLFRKNLITYVYRARECVHHASENACAWQRSDPQLNF